MNLKEANGTREFMLIDILPSAVDPGENTKENQRSPMKEETHRIVMNVVLVQTSDLVIFLHLFAFIGFTLLQCIQQLTLDASKSCDVKGKS